MLVGVSFAVIYMTVRFFHFSHAAIYTLGAYLFFLFKIILKFDFVLSIALALFFSGLIGVLIDFTIFKRLRNKTESPLPPLIASLGLYIVMQNFISLAFGDDVKIINLELTQRVIQIWDGRITLYQLITFVVSLLLLIISSIFIRHTRLGLGIRAVANDVVLAQVSGVQSNFIISWVFWGGSFIVGIAGIIKGYEIGMTPTMGMNALMMGIIAMIVAGVKNLSGIFWGALLLSFSQNIGVWYLGGTWQEVIPFLVLFIFLLLRPKGFRGK
jgi:branched-chain amino acid transport system permease protein